MRLIFWNSIFAVIFLSIAWIIAYSKYHENKDDMEQLEEEEMNKNMDRLMKLEIRRRMALRHGSINF